MWSDTYLFNNIAENEIITVLCNCDTTSFFSGDIFTLKKKKSVDPSSRFTNNQFKLCGSKRDIGLRPPNRDMATTTAYLYGAELFVSRMGGDSVLNITSAEMCFLRGCADRVKKDREKRRGGTRGKLRQEPPPRFLQTALNIRCTGGIDHESRELFYATNLASCWS